MRELWLAKALSTERKIGNTSVSCITKDKIYVVLDMTSKVVDETDFKQIETLISIQDDQGDIIRKPSSMFQLYKNKTEGLVEANLEKRIVEVEANIKKLYALQLKSSIDNWALAFTNVQEPIKSDLISVKSDLTSMVRQCSYLKKSDSIPSGAYSIYLERLKQIEKGHDVVDDVNNNSEGQFRHVLVGLARVLYNNDNRTIIAYNHKPKNWDKHAWDKMCYADTEKLLTLIGSFAAAELDRIRYVKNNKDNEKTEK